MSRGHRTTWALGAVLAAVALVVPGAPTLAENVENKFRFGLAIGGYNTQDQVSSDSANVLVLRDESDIPVNFIRDPRNDSGVFGDLTIKPATRVTLAAQYAFNKIFVMEASVGYQEDTVGDIEIQAQFTRVTIPTEDDFLFAIYRIPAGEMTQVPIQISALARLRPRTNFNPYFGGGVGYVIIGFDPSPEFNELSRRMDRSVGGFSPLFGERGLITLAAPFSFEDLDGATVDARDTFAWHLVGGAELSFKSKWVIFLDLRYMFASRTMSIGFNGSDSLGRSVPQRDDRESLLPVGAFGPVLITQGGLVDGGRLVPIQTAPQGTNCSVDPTFCEFKIGQPDGQLDTGHYYVQGGDIKYGGVSAQLGVRFTF